jgi:hypothetical protein
MPRALMRFRAPDTATADRHRALGIRYAGLLSRGDHVGAAEFLARMYADPGVDPWVLILALGGLAVVRLGAQAHPAGEG